MPRLRRLLLTSVALLAALALPAGAVGAPTQTTHNSPGPLLWTAPASVDTSPLNAIACPSTTLCIAVGRAGKAVWSTNPTAGPRAWQGATIAPGRELTSIACPSVSLCVAVDGAGDAVTSSNPTGGPTAWSVARIDTSSTQNNSDTAGPILLRDVACPSTTECVAVDAAGNDLVSGNPTGGAPAWTINHADANRSFGCSGAGLACQPPLIAVSCPAVTVCAAVDFSGNILTTQEPTGTGPWPSVPTDPGRLGSLWGVSCPLTSFCATVDGPSDRVITFSPLTPDVQVARALPDGLYGVWCQSDALCLASASTPSGASGLVGSYTPASPRASWPLSSPGAVTGVTCPAPVECLAVDGQGDVVSGVSTHAVAGLLNAALPRGRHLPTMAALDRGRRPTVTIASPISARVTLRWTLRGTGGTLAVATHRFTGPGRARLTLALTALGAQLFHAAPPRLAVTTAATFSASSGSLAVSGTRTFTHPPRPRQPVTAPRHSTPSRHHRARHG